MRTYLIVLLSLVHGTIFSQSKTSVYLEVRGSIDILGNIYLNEVVKPKRLEARIDSLVDYDAIKRIFPKNTDPLNVLNALSKEGWNLVSVTQVLSDKDGKPNTPFLLYYFRREY